MKILYIACYSPYISNSAGIGCLNYLNNLVKIEGNEVHLLTVDFPKDSIYYDGYNLSMLDKRVKVHAISGGALFNKVMPKKKKVISQSNEVKQNKTKPSNLNKLLKKIKSVVITPDMYFNWASRAANYAIELMNKESFDVMYSMHEPPSSHVCAYKIKEKFPKLQWVAYWSDPWVRDPIRANMPYIRKKYETALEKKIVNKADKYVFVTDANRRDYIKYYGIPEEKTYLINRGFDKEKYEEILEEASPKYIMKDKINLVYAGEIFSKLRDVRPLIAVLDRLEKENQKLYNKLNILFFGNIDNQEIKEKLSNVKAVSVWGRIPYKEALSYMLHSDILILYGNKNSNQIPAKIYDYFGTKSFIYVILGDENDPIKYLVENNEKCTVVDNNEEDLMDGLYKILQKVEDKKVSAPIMEYEWSNIGNRLYNILKE
ncbi:glycosyltransferase [Hathewaya limosa]|uniref:Glycosyltransferase involved in cell wall biosynthesis n=1 Tax=Hathewaya limosa TaxID=1536 RepID=A0ABU0JUB3_HATLI|nr:glycosyltransferase [Hathewaya limosa]AWZ49105.1 glycosyl transferase group 1 [Clostridiaceae bacterium 14S0207]MDQ0479649.1 glycosyltransferase involved in cell wall biosynthesis [Hathewaya limosa]